MVLVTPAFAVSIANQDTKEHTVTVDRGAMESKQKVASGDTLRVDCPERCGFRVVGSGYGRQPGPDGKLVIDKAGMLRFAEETAANGAR
ncbi:hypothetical protein ACYCO6_34410 [Methylobacterium sp. CM6257]